jgi:hypothetical protein
VLRALSLVDVLAQLNQDSQTDVPFDPSEVINQFVADQETLNVGSETLTLATITDYPVNVIQDVGPVAYWRLDDPLASTAVYDSSPWASTTFPKVPGTVSGGMTFQVTGAMNGSKCATFDATTGYFEVANTASLQRVGDLTIEFWLKVTSLAAAQVIVSKGTTGEFHVLLNTNGSISLLMGPSYNTVVIPAASITTGTWFHVAIVRTAAGKKVNAYLNGVSQFSGTYTTTPSTTTNVVRVGASSPGTAASFFNGQLDEVVLYAKALTATQVAAHYAWGTAADVGSTGWGTGRYGYIQYPTPGAATGSPWGVGVWGTFVWN